MYISFNLSQITPHLIQKTLIQVIVVFPVSRYFLQYFLSPILLKFFILTKIFYVIKVYILFAFSINVDGLLFFQAHNTTERFIKQFSLEYLFYQ